MPKFVPRERKHKVRQRIKHSRQYGTQNASDTNASEIQQSTASEKERRRNTLREELRSQQTIKTSKKQKRLDKYIDKKLRKEENLELIKKLSGGKIDTSVLRNTSSLGIKRLPRIGIIEHDLKATKAGFDVESDSNGPSESDGTEFTRPAESSSTSHDQLESVADFMTATKRSVSGFGSGLKRALGDQNGDMCIIKKRRRHNNARPLTESDVESPWEGFSSTDVSAASVASEGTQTEEDDSDSELEFSSAGEDYDSDAPQDTTSHKILKNHEERSSAFKAWATQQVNEAMNFIPSFSNLQSAALQPTSRSTATVPGNDDHEPLPPELRPVSNVLERKAFSVKVKRSSSVEEARLGLPVVAEEQKIMEAVFNHSTVIISSATGSGKTTQVPQFLFEAGFGSPGSLSPGMIGVTQPRRVAAVSMARRVAEELGDACDKVAYQIRFDSSVSDRTAVKFMTDGILIREIASDFALSKYSVIIIDEAHERSTNTDILIGMLSRIVGLRETMSKEDDKIKPLKLIIMSATLRIKDFLENRVLFRDGPPPLIQAEGRQFPVTVHFARKTKRDFVDEAFHKVCKGHKKLPPGGMLVFLTGQNEITSLTQKLRTHLSSNSYGASSDRKVYLNATQAPLETEDMEFNNHHESIESLEEIDDDGDDSIFGHEDDEKDFEIDDFTPASCEILVLPLYSQLQTKDQLRVFQPVPENTRLIVLATNIAETSLSIPGIRYVFDCGRAKTKTFDQDTGVQGFEVGWISKASAAQRAGRAGRTSPGHCYRLYSSAVYERDFEEHTKPEILGMPVEGVVLQLKSMDLEHVVNFPFPTPPNRQSLMKAEKLLSHLGAISSEGKLTPLGRDLSLYPLSPRFAKMLSIGHQHGCMPYTIALVAALVTTTMFIPESHLDLSNAIKTEEQTYTNEDRLADDARTKRRSAYNHAHHLLSTHSPTSDAVKSLTALCAWAYASDKTVYCKEMFLSSKAVTEAAQLFSQLSSVVHSTRPSLLPNPGRTMLTQLPSPSKVQIAALQQFVAAAFIDQIAVLASAAPNPPSDLGRKPSRAIDVPYLPLFPITTTRKGDMDIADLAVYIHPSSLLAHRDIRDLPTYVVYRHLQRAAPSTIGDSKVVKTPKTRMHPLVTVTGRQLASLVRGTSLLEYGKPIGKIEEIDGGKKRVCWVVPCLVGEKRGGTGWPLPAIKVVQTKRGSGSGWEVESVIG